MTDHPNPAELRERLERIQPKAGVIWRLVEDAIDAYEAALEENRRLLEVLALLVKDKGFQFVKEDKHGVFTRATFQEATAVIGVTDPQSSSGWVDATPCGCFMDQGGRLHTCSGCQEDGGEE